MVLEATLICLDNSDWSRNGDYAPSRFEAQTDTADVVSRAKSRGNPENATGVLTMAGERVEVRASPTPDLGTVMEALASIPTNGQSDFIRGIMTAQLALKHRQNKMQRQRIVVFVASPMDVSEAKLETVGRTLKKNNVSLDIISLGEIDGNAKKIQCLFDAVNNQDTSHVVEVPQGSLVSEVVRSSPILRVPGEAAQPGAGGGAANEGDELELGVDPNVDPDLYMALRMSLEEENKRKRETDTKIEPAQAAETTELSAGSASVTAPQAIPAEIAPSEMPHSSLTSFTRPHPNLTHLSHSPASHGHSSYTTPASLRDTIDFLSAYPSAERDIEQMENLDPDLKMALLLSLRTEQPSEGGVNSTASNDVNMGDEDEPKAEKKEMDEAIEQPEEKEKDNKDK
eukprot:GHVN01080846.1.p1 GENE.GHVN01080846.1~~GHVN01080846.1.p1  ORF type:complete len:399 (+),score=120.11 GHVN01080846.1:61-1257(+)